MELFLRRRVFFSMENTAYEMRISDWSSDLCSSVLLLDGPDDDLAEISVLIVPDSSDRHRDLAQPLGEFRVLAVVVGQHDEGRPVEIGSASGRERGCQ